MLHWERVPMTSVFQPVMTNLLTAVIFLPLAGALLLVFLPRENHRLLRNVTFAVTLVGVPVLPPPAGGAFAVLLPAEKTPPPPAHGALRGPPGGFPPVAAGGDGRTSTSV